MPTSSRARAKRRITALEEEVESMKQERRGKQRKTTYYVAQGRAIHRMVCLYTSLEDLVAENNRRYEDSDESTMEYVANFPFMQDRLQRGYIEFAWTLPWLHMKLRSLEHEESEDMLKKLKKGADAARGDDTSSLKELVAMWVNQDFRLPPLVKPNDKHLRSFASDICRKLLCPAEWDWNSNHMKAGIRNRTSDYIISENSWPMFTYENYTINRDNLEEGFLKSKLLVLAFKAIFTLPSSAKEVDGDSDGADIIENNRRAQRKSDQTKVHFALSSVTSWCTVDSDFNYEAFWNNIVDFFEDTPGPAMRRRMDKLLEWWTRKIFGTNHRTDLTPEVVSHMSINTLYEQWRAMEDAVFDSD
ncbi:hypothetical protein EDD22DRAFT_787567 [Suillus occidentalis]|nr:hypothetical protein EDD22DRAFT_787567 [Suillus occidentalis]